MTRRLVNLTLDNLSDLPAPCRSCIFWELDPVSASLARADGDTGLQKEAWVSDTLLEWGSCGQILYVDGAAAGYVLYAPPLYVPRAVSFPTAPVSADAVLLMTARILPAYAGAGLGRILIQGTARDVIRRGIRAIEAFGRVGAQDRSVEPFTSTGCLLPAGYLRAVGFATVRAHPRTPRLRLDVKATVTWREDMESALERLRGSIQSPVLSR